MKIFFSESKPEYQSYTFNYGIYCIKESNDALSDIYQSGFLPYSASTALSYEVFYRARSLRVELDRFDDTSENRRVDRKIESLNIQMEVLYKKQVLSIDQGFIPFCENYISSRIGEAMSTARLKYILGISIGTHIFRFTKDHETVGYVLAAIDSQIVHYWFSFFDLELMKTHSLGKWMMWSVIRWAMENQKQQVYLGTAYGEKALYKVRDHKGLSFFDGNRWNQDMDLLKSWCKTDQERNATDRFKLAADPEVYIKNML